MKERTCFRENARDRYDRLCSQAARKVSCENVTDLGPMPLPSVRDFAKSAALILVEVEGGVVQNVSLLSQSGQPITVLVRDYDDYKEQPDDYQDAEWVLG